MTRAEIISKVQNILKNNPQIDSFFEPVIEEFFCRLSEQYNIDDQKLEEKINKYYQLTEMKLDETKSQGRFVKNLGLYGYDYDWSKINDEGLKISRQFITIDKDSLKKILLGNKEEILGYINTTFHEQGHLIQSIFEEKFHYAGLLKREIIYQSNTYNDSENGMIYQENTISYSDIGNIINEYAETINAERLTRGNLQSGQYSGYENIQSTARAIAASYGMTDRELSDLQMLGTGRKEYEKMIKENSNNEDMIVPIVMENALDTIYAISIGAKTEKDFYIHDLKTNMEISFKNINELTNTMLERRLQKPGADIARIIVDKEVRDENLSKALEFFKSQLPEGFELDIEPNKINDQIGDLVNDENIQKRVEEIKKERIEEENKLEYDNSYLINRVIQQAQDYDISKFSLKDRIKYSIYKKISKFKTKNKNDDIKLLPESTDTDVKEQGSTFREDVKSETKIILNNNVNTLEYSNNKKRDEKDEDIR